MQKTTEEGKTSFLSGCLIKALRHDGGGMSPLNVSIIPLSVIPECLYCLLFVTPAIFKPGSRSI